jgi:hypothetical protein
MKKKKILSAHLNVSLLCLVAKICQIVPNSICSSCFVVERREESEKGIVEFAMPWLYHEKQRREERQSLS